jgi:hypothetical protein
MIPMAIQPDPEDPGCADVLVDATIAGRPYRLRLDTGAARTELVADDYLATLPSNGSHTSHGAFGGAETQDVITIPDLVIGQFAAAFTDVVRAAAAPGRSSLLGMDLLGLYCCEFRFDSEVLVLTGSPALQASLPLRLSERGHLYVDLSWSEVTATGCWDSGSGITVVDKGFAYSHPELFNEVGTSTGTDSTGTTIQTPTYAMTGPLIGGTQFGSSLVAVIDMTAMNQGLSNPVDLIVGYPLYRQANWLFDVPARRWSAPELVGAPK